MYPPQRYYLTNLGDRSTVKELPSRLGMMTDEFVAKQIRELLLRFCMGWTISFSSNFETRPKVLSKKALASSRTKRMMTKIRKKYGFFCEEFINRELAEKPSYYQGYMVYHFDEVEEYCKQWSSTLTPAEILGRMVTLGIPPENPQLKALQARREAMMAAQRERIKSPEFQAEMERKRKLNEEREKERKRCYERWLMSPARDEDSLFHASNLKDGTHEP